MNRIQIKELQNAGWLIGGRAAQMLLSFLVGVLTARYLGPGNYGVIHYAGSYVAFFSAFCTLGINSVLLKELSDAPERQGQMLGTAIALRLTAGGLSVLTICGIALAEHMDEPVTAAVVVLCSVSLLFRAFELLQYWFQLRYRAHVTAVITFVAYGIYTGLKVILLILKKNVIWFAFASAAEYGIVSVLLLVAYQRSGGPPLSVSWSWGRTLLRKSYHYILSGMMVAIYGHTDKLMLQMAMNEDAVGFYGAAVSVCSMWVFVLTALIDSMHPTILAYFKSDAVLFERKNRQLYALVFYISCGVSLFLTIFAEPLVHLLYGEAYLPAAKPLRIITWYTAFSYLGVARNPWLVCQGKQHYLKYIYLAAAVINILLNLLWIPLWGPSGAAQASLVTQIFTCLILPLCIQDLRPNVRLMLQAIGLRGIFEKNALGKADWKDV